MYVDKVHYRARIGFGVSETTPYLVNYVYVDIGFGVSETIIWQ